MTCPSCGVTVSDEARYCPQCGWRLAGPPSEATPGHCTTCGTLAPSGAIFCTGCGRQLSGSGSLANPSADLYSQVAASGLSPTSSSGRDPALTPEQRASLERIDGGSSGRQAAELRQLQLQQLNAGIAERAALAPPPPTGDSLRDLGAADEWFGKIDAVWDGLDQDLKSARNAAGLFPSAADRIELNDLASRTAAAWASREAARRYRDRLFAEDSGVTPKRAAEDERRMLARGWELRAELDRKPDVRRR